MNDALYALMVISISTVFALVASRHLRRKEQELLISDMKRWHASEAKKLADEIRLLKDRLASTAAELERSREFVTVQRKEIEHTRAALIAMERSAGKESDELAKALKEIERLRDEKESVARYVEDNLKVILDQANCAMSQLR